MVINPIITLDEQHKIVSCPSAVHEIISAQPEKIIPLQLHKKVLIQRVFLKVTD